MVTITVPLRVFNDWMASYHGREGAPDGDLPPLSDATPLTTVEEDPLDVGTFEIGLPKAWEPRGILARNGPTPNQLKQSKAHGTLVEMPEQLRKALAGGDAVEDPRTYGP